MNVVLYGATGNAGSEIAKELKISFADYAIAMVDEIERPAHHRSSFSVSN